MESIIINKKHSKVRAKGKREEILKKVDVVVVVHLYASFMAISPAKQYDEHAKTLVLLFSFLSSYLTHKALSYKKYKSA